MRRLCRWFKRARLAGTRRAALAVLAAWRKSLPPEARLVLTRQLRATRALEPELLGKTVGFAIRRKHAEPFPNQERVHAARVELEATVVGPLTLTCDIYCSRGWLSELEFDRPTYDVGRVSTRSARVHCYADLTQPASEHPRAAAPAPGEIPMLTEIATPDEVLPPAPPPERAAFAAAWSHVVPDDFLQLCDWTDGLVFGGWEVLCTQAYYVALTLETNLLVLATGPDACFLCARVPFGKQAGVELFEHDFPVPVGRWQSFIEALRFVTRFVAR